MSSSETRTRGASDLSVSRWQRLKHWTVQHRLESADAVKRLLHNRLSTLVTMLLLAVVLAVPTFMYSLLGNLKQLTPGTDFEPQLALYLSTELKAEELDRFSRSLLLRDDLLSVELISSDVGANEFKSHSELGELMTLLDENPLPAVVLAITRDQDPATMKLLRESMAALPEVDVAELDVEWLERLEVIVGSFSSISFVLALLLSMTVLLVIANTIRTMISSRQEEIEVSLLIGATGAWVRRPFLYAGLLYGFFGALLSLLLVYFSLALVEAPLAELTELYIGRFDLQGPDLSLIMALLMGGTILGWIGAFIAVSRQMGQLHQGSD
ncbi:MAG: Cell division protein FtsX [Marinobacterium sp. xm-d-530]|nr:MAG: Cell division protein FtsX [Marinobacterium sp. xm-d-530]